MEPIEYLRAARHWWAVIAATVLLGLAAAWVTTPSGTSYSASHILLLGSGVESGGGEVTGVSRLAFLTTTGAVPDRVALKLGEDPDDVSALVAHIDAVPDTTLGTLIITANDASARRAEVLANTFAEELKASVTETSAAEAEEAAADAAEVRAQIDDVTGQIAAAPEGTVGGLEAERDRLEERLSGLEEIVAGVESDSELSTVDEAEAERAGSLGRLERMVIAGGIGLLLGVGLALVLARFDTRIRTKEQAERVFEAPVLAEIPMLARRRRKRREVVTVSDPSSLTGEAYRGLRTGLMLQPGPNGAAVEGRSRPRRARSGEFEYPQGPIATNAVLVVSATVAEGKTTTVANLAAVFAEAGKSVIALNCDLRRPSLHEHFGLTVSPGLTDVFAGDDGDPSFADVVRDTDIPHVRVVTSGEPAENPGELLNRNASVVATARNFTDIVVIDTSPILATDDASALVRHVNDVVIVCRAGKTREEAARRTSELLGRLGAPVRGVVLVGSTTPTARSYYRSEDQRTRSRHVPKREDPNGPSKHRAPAQVTEPERSG